MSALREDVRYALRRMRREPGFTTFAVLIIALGVAAATTVFSVMSPLILRPLPFKEPERLVCVGVAQNFLDVLGVRPLLGRGFTAEESVWNGRKAVILTHGFWVRRFG